MIFFLQEDIDSYERFCGWFNAEAVPQIESSRRLGLGPGGRARQPAAFAPRDAGARSGDP